MMLGLKTVQQNINLLMETILLSMNLTLAGEQIKKSRGSTS